MKSRVIPTIALVVFASVASAERHPASAPVDVAAGCSSTHGRMFVANGNPPVRIWKVGTKRILGVAGGENPRIPGQLKHLLAPGTYIYADFEVCAITPERAGVMQSVWVRSAKNVVIERYREPDGPSSVEKLPGKIGPDQ